MRRAIPLLLVVDDDGAAAEELTDWLCERGFHAVAATSCLEARAIVGAVAVEGMIGHLALPDGSLFEIAQALRAKRAGALVVGYASVEVVPPPELDGCFVRPLDPSVLGPFLTARLRPQRSGEHRLVGVKRVAAAAAGTAPRRR